MRGPPPSTGSAMPVIEVGDKYGQGAEFLDRGETLVQLPLQQNFGNHLVARNVMGLSLTVDIASTKGV
jgi:hypothetical protein